MCQELSTWSWPDSPRNSFFRRCCQGSIREHEPYRTLTRNNVRHVTFAGTTGEKRRAFFLKLALWVPAFAGTTGAVFGLGCWMAQGFLHQLGLPYIGSLRATSRPSSLVTFIAKWYLLICNASSTSLGWYCGLLSSKNF